MSTARIGSWPARPTESTARHSPPMPRSPQEAANPALVPAGRAVEDSTIDVVKDLVRYARAADLVLADEVLTDILAKLHGWPVEELNRLR